MKVQVMVSQTRIGGLLTWMGSPYSRSSMHVWHTFFSLAHVWHT